MRIPCRKNGGSPSEIQDSQRATRINHKKNCAVGHGVLTLCKCIEESQVSELVQIVDALENKISKLLHKLEVVQQSNRNLERELAALRQANDTADAATREWEEKYNSLKMANSMLGSDTNKTEAKLKINALIRELDHCIVQLAE